MGIDHILVAGDATNFWRKFMVDLKTILSFSYIAGGESVKNFINNKWSLNSNLPLVYAVFQEANLILAPWLRRH